MEKHFTGMSAEEFSYDEYEDVRKRLVSEVNAGLSDEDRKLIMSVKELAPDWGIKDYSHYPSVRWKLFNLQKLKSANPAKHAELASALRGKLWPSKS